MEIHYENRRKRENNESVPKLIYEGRSYTSSNRKTEIYSKESDIIINISNESTIENVEN